MNAAARRPILIRNVVFGVEDSLVSTVGLLSGISVGGADRAVILLTGFVLIFVEAFSMAVGSFLSEETSEEYSAHREVSLRGPVLGGTVMFVSYFLSGFVPLLPYVILGASAFWISILASLAALAVLGSVSARLLGLSVRRGGLRALFVGGIAVLAGGIIGNLVR